jgi:hypothetical protein
MTSPSQSAKISVLMRYCSIFRQHGYVGCPATRFFLRASSRLSSAHLLVCIAVSHVFAW